MNFNDSVIKTASKMYGISFFRSKELVEQAYKNYNGSQIKVKEEDVLLFVGRMVLPCVN